jgi:hypothetical protein
MYVFFKFPKILPQFMSLSYLFSHLIFTLGNTCGLRIFCIHFGFKSFGLIKILQFDNNDFLDYLTIQSVDNDARTSVLDEGYYVHTRFSK